MPQWAFELKQGVYNLLSSEYRLAARWKIDGDYLILDFPAIQLSALDFKSGLTRALSEFNGETVYNRVTLQTELKFPKPTKQEQVVSSYPAQQQQVGNTTTAVTQNKECRSEVKNSIAV